MPFARTFTEFREFTGLSDGQLRALRRDHGLPRRGPDGLIPVDANCRAIVGVARSIQRLPRGVIEHARAARAEGRDGGLPPTC